MDLDVEDKGEGVVEMEVGKPREEGEEEEEDSLSQVIYNTISYILREDMLNQITPTNPSSSRWIPRTVIGDLPFVALSVSFAPRFLGSLLVFSFFSLFASLTSSFLC